MLETTAEKFMLLIQHPEKAWILINPQTRDIGLVGAILMDLANEKKIAIDNGKLVVLGKDSQLSPFHDALLKELVSSPTDRKIRSWILRFARWKIKDYRNQLILELDKKGLIKAERRSFLGIKYYRTRLRDRTQRIRMIERLRELILHSQRWSSDDLPLLGLIHACKMYRTVGHGWREQRDCRRKLKVILKSEPIAREVDQVIRETQAAIVSATAAASVAISASSS